MRTVRSERFFTERNCASVRVRDQLCAAARVPSGSALLRTSELDALEDVLPREEQHSVDRADQEKRQRDRIG